MNKTAVINHETDLDRVRAYLPSNYQARHALVEVSHGVWVKKVIITGYDSAGWTLEGYVIPRLASGLIFAEIRGQEL